MILLHILPVGIVEDLRVFSVEDCSGFFVAGELIQHSGDHVAVRAHQHLLMLGPDSSCPDLWHVVCDAVIVDLTGEYTVGENIQHEIQGKGGRFTVSGPAVLVAHYDKTPGGSIRSSALSSFCSLSLVIFRAVQARDSQYRRLRQRRSSPQRWRRPPACQTHCWK